MPQRTKRLAQTWKRLVNGAKDIDFSTRKFDDNFLNALSLTKTLRVNAHKKNQQIVEEINRLLTLNIMFIPVTRGEIQKYCRVLFWERQRYCEMNLRQLISLFESFCQSVIYKYLTEAKTRTYIMGILGDTVNNLRNLAEREGRGFELHEALATIYTREKMSNFNSFAEQFKAVGLFDDSTAVRFDVYAKQLAFYKKIRNIYEHNSGRTIYYRSEKNENAFIDIFPRLFLSSQMITHASGLCIKAAHLLRKRFDVELQRTGKELFEAYLELRQGKDASRSMSALHLTETELSRMLRYYYGRKTEINFSIEEQIRLLIAAIKRFKSKEAKFSTRT
jgi:hypothetical protein